MPRVTSANRDPSRLTAMKQPPQTGPRTLDAVVPHRSATALLARPALARARRERPISPTRSLADDHSRRTPQLTPRALFHQALSRSYRLARLPRSCGLGLAPTIAIRSVIDDLHEPVIPAASHRIPRTRIANLL